ncbi:MAG: GIY-YIG nuclease family protein [Clostridia bacterium]|nr:GIY-YIG nuclease family protein [Clostridia bacterium]
MPRNRPEDAQMKVPAMLHLSRLGYTLITAEMMEGRDRETNILPDLLREEVSRINGQELPLDRFSQLMGQIGNALDRKDLGESFYRILRDGWDGWKLIDYDHPDRNVFQMAAELSCGRGKTRFRPDITLFVNGLPLGMMELKTRVQSKGIREEYDRMVKRFQQDAFRRYLQIAQVWAFSNDRENDRDRILPTEGTFYATGARRDFPIYAFRSRTLRDAKLPPLSMTAEKEILAAHGMIPLETNRTFRRNLSSQTPTHRMLTGLFAPERFLFLLRYGIQYALEENPAGETENQKRLLSQEQFASLWSLREKALRGYANWTIQADGAAGETRLLAATVRWLREQDPDSRICWIVPDRRAMRAGEETMKAFGIPCCRRGRNEDGDLMLAEPSRNPAEWMKEAGEQHFTGRRIFLIPENYGRTAEGRRFERELRRAAPGMIRIHWRSAVASAGENYAYMLRCADGTLYCGWTNDLDRRVKTHNEGRGAKYTRSRRPVRLVYSESFGTREEAMSREWHLKRLTRAQKERLISGQKQIEVPQPRPRDRGKSHGTFGEENGEDDAG